MVPFFINKNNYKYNQELEMSREFLESLQYCNYSTLIFYNQGPFSNLELYQYLSQYNLKFEILGSGINVGIVQSRYIMTRYIIDKYPDCKYVAEVHLDMIFSPNWEQPLIEFLESTDEPFIAPRIVYNKDNAYFTTGSTEKINFPKLLSEKISVLNSLRENIVIEGFVHPVIHKLKILKEIHPYDVRFLTGKQGYEDDSLLLGYSYYIGTRNKWKPKICFNSCVYHKVVGQRGDLPRMNLDFNKNLYGLKVQYGSYGLEELSRIHGSKSHFTSEYKKSILNKNIINKLKFNSFNPNALPDNLVTNDYTSRYFVTNDSNSDTIFLKIPTSWWSRYYEYTWASKFIDESDICLDIGCGIYHPFKFYLANICPNVYACDKDINIENKDFILSSMKRYFNSDDINKAKDIIDNINFKNCSIVSLPFNDNTFDKIYCISLLHLISNSEIIDGLKELFRVLKNHGLLIITVDTPTINIRDLISSINNIGFKFKGDLIDNIYSNAIFSKIMGGIYCFRILLTK